MRCLLFLCLLLGTLPGFALDRSQVEGYLLPNGLQVLLKSGYERNHVSIRLVVGVGFDDFPCAQQELPHLLEHLLFSGIDEGGEGGLEKRMQALGGEWNAYTSSADTTFVIEAPARNQRKVLDLLLAVIKDTEIDEDDLALSKRIVEREDGGHYTHLQRWLDRQDIGHRSSDQLAVELGLKCAERSAIDEMTLEQVNDLRQHWYAANNMSLIVVGGLDRLLPAYLERSYGELTPAEPGERRALDGVTQKADARRELDRGWLGDSAKLHWLFLEPVLDNDHGQTFDLLQRYLDWALYEELRLKHGVSYGPYTQRETFGDTGVMSLNADVDRADLKEAEQALGDMLDRLRKNGLDPATFARIKQAAIDREAWTTQGNSALADYYWGALNDYLDGRFSDPARTLRRVSLEDANLALKQLLLKPGYVRIERPLISYNELYGLIALGLGLILAGILLWIRHRMHRRSYR
ncbi:Peptidase M16 inactive domain protein [compost metagenome]|uniref:M16 family metallopeptidase n=1 Tax=Pseudomonas sp. JUb96 TaxID=2940539 RepID=UPI000F9B43E0|nr:insulinase family protein [Pseudomonas sp. JUb96]MCW2268812.1 putative Zn-dependent peptidase [Pseudomonas sp. JUb96]